MVGELDRNPQLLKHCDGSAPEVVSCATGHIVKVSGLIHWHWQTISPELR